MLTPELEVTIANWMLFGKQLRDLTVSLRHDQRPFTPEVARVLDDGVQTLDRVGNEIVDQLLDEVLGTPAQHRAANPADIEPRMIHDTPAVYQPEAPRGWLRDMAQPLEASNVVPFRSAPKGCAK